MENLLNGGYIKARIRDNQTYDFENAVEDDFWSIRQWR